MKMKLLISLCSASLLAALALPDALTAQQPLSAPGRYSVTDLGVVGPEPGQPFSVTQDGLVSGNALTKEGVTHAILWFGGIKLDIGKKGLGGSNSVAFGANQWGQVVGEAETGAADPNGEDFCGFKFFGLPSSGSCLAFVWQNDKMTALPALGGNNAGANQINNHGDVAGYAETAAPDSGCPSPQVLQFKPTLWSKGKAWELRTFSGDKDGTALGINDNGQVVGASGDCALFNPNLLFPLQPLHALLWDHGTMTDLGTLGGTGHGFGNVALNLNSKGHVVGNSDLTGDTAGHAFLWTKATGMQDLGTLPGDFISAGLGINDQDEVVGVSLDSTFNPRAYLRRNGHMFDLNKLIPPNSALALLVACSINDRGEIIGLAVDTGTGEPHGFLARPID